ncbi:acyl-CoA thioesterase [Hyphomicrobium sulfonivorans]|uniref:acyl-CoA thioesterase n=1 Tax=Hyphomicrobium sulfonivorans TaxID=121290 RepID=UPI00156E7ACB|nr:hotdog domain-containing protein [Hyphomicrobium sulfonivorans]MBI1650448.1 acyl-CoA thioesterase [Hyphomicrobium sulfonivorans]NSL72192.1 acyl-CoA thioesterase [Hyphomicrobium sulfonivorans]
MNAADPNETRFTEIIFPAQANHYGTLFGGTALNLMGKAAVIAAARRAGANVVMAAADHVDFYKPVAVGQLVELCARVERIGRTSMTVSVDVIAEHIKGGERQLAMRGTFEMVSVDDDGRPIPVNRMAPEPA